MGISIYSIIQIVLSLMLVVLVLIQVKGTGLGSEFGGGLGFYSTRRGVERWVFYLTIATASLFLLFSLVRILL